MATEGLRTLADLPFFTTGRYPRPELIGRAGASGITWTSGRDLLEIVRDLSLGLATLGMARGERVAILSESRPDWLFADLAVLAAGAVTVPLYPTLSARQIGTMLRDSEPTIAIVSTGVLLDRLLSVAADVPSLRTVVVMDLLDAPPASPWPIVTLAEVSARGHRRILDGWGVARTFHDEAKRVVPDDPATLIYTSGTTAEPKGVVLTHGNLIANLEGLKEVLNLTEEDLALSFLPLCHAFERIVCVRVPRLWRVGGVRRVDRHDRSRSAAGTTDGHDGRASRVRKDAGARAGSRTGARCPAAMALRLVDWRRPSAWRRSA